MSKISYRPDIDGLRAVAVLSVLAFHISSTTFPSAYVGVDVFFVISGYLITSIILSELKAEKFSFVDFYGRRIRRIFPTLILVLLATWSVGCLFFLPSDFAALGKHMLAGSAFVANFALWGDVGYFEPAAEFKPLLHLWSLGIEEQFYLVWPVVLVLSHKLRINIAAIATVLAAASFFYFLNVSDDNAFYLPQSRAWELMIGSALAAISSRVNGNNFLSAAGFALIGAGILFSTDIGRLGLLLPTVGAALVLISPKSDINKIILTNPVAVLLGKISYALYLWHWPLLSLARIHGEDQTVQIAVVVASFPLSWLTWRLVEVPLRQFEISFTTTALTAILAMVAGLGGLTMALSGIPSRFDNAIMASMDERGPPAEKRWQNNKCFLERGVGPEAFNSNCIEKGDNPLILVWGDSHAERLMPGLFELQKNRRFRLGLIGASLCPPVPYVDITSSPSCRAINDYALIQ